MKRNNIWWMNLWITAKWKLKITLKNYQNIENSQSVDVFYIFLLKNGSHPRLIVAVFALIYVKQVPYLHIAAGDSNSSSSMRSIPFRWLYRRIFNWLLMSSIWIAGRLLCHYFCLFLNLFSFTNIQTCELS